MTPFYVSTSSLATLLRLTSRRIQQLVTLKILPKPLKAGHDVYLAVPAYLGYLERPAESTTLSEARKKKVEVETKIRVLELRRREGELVLQSKVDNDFFRLARTTRDGFLNLPSRTAALVASESDQHRCFDILQKEVLQILESLTRDTTPHA